MNRSIVYKAAFFLGAQLFCEFALAMEIAVQPTPQITALHLAVEELDLIEVTSLLQHNADVNAVNANGDTPLHRASLLGAVEICEKLCAKGVQVNRVNNDGNTPLHLAAMQGHDLTCSFLVYQGAKLELQNRRGQTAFQLAEEANQRNVYGMLMPSDSLPLISIMQDDAQALVPVHGNSDSFLLQIPQPITSSSPRISTASATGLSNSLSLIPQSLVASRLSNNMPIEAAITIILDEWDREGYSDDLEKREQRRKKLTAHFPLLTELAREPREGNPVLLRACGARPHFRTAPALDLAFLLLEHGYMPAQDSEGTTPLMYVTSSAYDLEESVSAKQLIKAMIARGAKVNERNKHGKTALHYCSADRFAAILVSAGGDPNFVDNAGTTPLLVAASCGNETMVRYLAPLVDLDHDDQEGDNALSAACAIGNVSVVKFLLNQGVVKKLNPSRKLHESMRLLIERHDAMRKARQQRKIEAMGDTFFRVGNVLALSRLPSETPLITAVRLAVRKVKEESSSAEIARAFDDIMIKAQAAKRESQQSISVRTGDGFTALLEVAALASLIESTSIKLAVYKIINALLSVDLFGLDYIDKLGNSALMYLCMGRSSFTKEKALSQQEKVCCLLLQKLLYNGADVNRKNNAGESPLAYACEFRGVESIRALVEAGADLNFVSNGMTPIQYAIWARNFDAARYLTPLIHLESIESAILSLCMIPLGNYAEEMQILQLLQELEKRLRGTFNIQEATQGKYAFHYACQNRSFETVQFLLAVHADLNRPDSEDNSPVMDAAAVGREDVVTALVPLVSDINVTNKEGVTILALVCKLPKRNLPLIKLVLSRGANPADLPPSVFISLDMDTRHVLEEYARSHFGIIDLSARYVHFQDERLKNIVVDAKLQHWERKEAFNEERHKRMDELRQERWKKQDEAEEIRRNRETNSQVRLLETQRETALALGKAEQKNKRIEGRMAIANGIVEMLGSLGGTVLKTLLTGGVI